MIVERQGNGSLLISDIVERNLKLKLSLLLIMLKEWLLNFLKNYKKDMQLMRYSLIQK
jgi:hypothetical protein